ncbi:MAG TPA: RNA-binding protein [Euryarchaeota archaeon]|nr:RNA-binding protein [Euryarchaeota archaeon]
MGMAEDKPKRWLVVPGEVITEEHVKLGPGVYIRDGKVVAKVLGLAEVRDGVARVIPLEGKYVPKVGDSVIGIIVDVKIPGYDVDINSPYMAFLPKDSVEGEADYGDVVVGTIKYVDEVRNALLENAVVLKGGELIHISPSRVPRVIGKNASMINLLKNMTGAAILVGANGRIWIHGGHLGVAKEAIFKIEREAHISGLTDRITKFLEDSIPEEERGKDAG